VQETRNWNHGGGRPPEYRIASCVQSRRIRRELLIMSTDIDTNTPVTGPDADLIRNHYADFNARRLDEAARRFDAQAPLEHVTGCIEFGPDGYRLFATRWLEGFPDAVLTVRCIHRRAPGLYEVDLLATGTHTGTLAFGSWVFRATNFELRLPARQLIQIEDGLIRFATLSFDLQDLVRLLTTVDTSKLQQYLGRIQQTAEQLAAAQPNPARQRELLDRLGAQLDAARHVVRPYFR